MMWVATPEASSMVATASITASRSSVTVPPLVGDRLSRPAGGLIQSQYRAPVFMQIKGINSQAKPILHHICTTT